MTKRIEYRNDYLTQFCYDLIHDDNRSEIIVNGQRYNKKELNDNIQLVTMANDFLLKKDAAEKEQSCDNCSHYDNNSKCKYNNHTVGVALDECCHDWSNTYEY